MGSAKSKTPVDDEENSDTLNSQKQTESFSSIQNSGTGSNNSLGDEYYVINKKSETKNLNKNGDFIHKGSSSNSNKHNVPKEQSKIRPHSLFDESNTDFKLIDTTLPDIEDGDHYPQNGEVTSFQPRSQYFRSFRYASKRLFGNNKKKIQNKPNDAKTEQIESSDSSDASSKIFKPDNTSFSDSIQKSKSHSDLSTKLGNKNKSTQSSSNFLDSEKIKRRAENSSTITARVKNFRNSFTSCSLPKEEPIERTIVEEASNNTKNNMNSYKKVRDIKLKDKARQNLNKSPVPSLTLDTSFNQNSNGLSDNEEEKNEDAIEHLKKQIEALNAQLHTIEKEDAKIINELSDKIDNLAKMNINTISSVGAQKNSQPSRFQKLFGKKSPKHSPQASPSSSQASFSGDYYARLQSQNDILLQQQSQIEQLKQHLLNSQLYAGQANMNSSYAHATPTENKKEEETEKTKGHDHATEEDTYDNHHHHRHQQQQHTYYQHTHVNGNAYAYAKAYYQQPGYHYSNQYTASPNIYSNQTYTNPNQYYVNGNAYYYPSGKTYQQPTQNTGQQFYYNPATGKYYYQKTNNAQYYYDPNRTNMYANATNTNAGAYFAYPNTNGENKSSNSHDESEPGVIITEVDDEDENEFGLGKNRDKFKDYVDAVSLKDE